MGAPWLRLYSEALRDRKIQRICQTTGHPKALVIGAWTTVLMLANESPVRGVLLFTADIPLTLEDIIVEMGLDKETGEAILGKFVNYDMLAVDGGIIRIANWDSRQFSSDNSTGRVREWRERQKENEEEPPGSDNGNGDETLPQRSCNVSVTDQIIETDTEAEAETEEDPPSAGANAPQTPPDQPKNAEKTRKNAENSGRNAPSVKQQAQAMFTALAEICQIDTKLLTKEQRMQLNQSEKRLRKAGNTPADLADFPRWWYANDWRGRKGEPPKPHQVRETWGQYEAWREARLVAAERPEREPQTLDLDGVLWDVILADLRGQMTQASYDAHLRNSKPTGRENGKLIVACVNQYSPDWLTNRLADVIGPTVARHEEGLVIEFVAVREVAARLAGRLGEGSDG